jgi:tetratricopeptide (TPR) repeat protein
MQEVDLYKKFSVPPPEPFTLDIPILVAEPQGELGLIIVHSLEKKGFFKVRREKDGRDALAALQKQPASVVLASDILPSCSGLDLLKELREEPKIQSGAFVFITKALNKSEVMLAVESGVNELLVRPFAPADIFDKIRSAYTNYQNPKNPERLFEFAKLLMKAQKYDAARTVYQDLALLNTAAARPHVGIARCHLAENDKEKALKAVTEAIQKNGQYVHGFALRANIFLGMGRQDEAVSDLKHAVDLSPLNIARLEACCDLLLSKGLQKECLGILGKAVAAGMVHPYVTERMGYCFFLEKEYSSALKYLREAVDLDPENARYLNSLAICYRDLKDFDESISTYNRIIKKDPENHQVLFNKALVLHYKGSTGDAIKLLRRVVQLKPDYEKAVQKLTEFEKDSGVAITPVKPVSP